MLGDKLASLCERLLITGGASGTLAGALEAALEGVFGRIQDVWLFGLTYQ
jgi:hypothetical protein